MTQLMPSYAFRQQRVRNPGYLFAFGIDDLSLEVPTGQTLTFDRNSTRTVFDSEGRVATLCYDQVPWSAAYNSTAGVWEPVYEPHTGTTNLVVRSEDFSAGWSSIGTPTRTAAAKRCGDLVLDLLGDDAAGTLEGYSQVVSFTANDVKSVSLFLAAGTSTSTVIRLRDTTASANRLLAVIAWAAGVPTVTMTTGTDIGTVTCYNGVYRFQFKTTTVTAANTNQLEIYPATTSGLATSGTGTVYVGGVQAENYAYARAYVKTEASTVATASDDLTTTLDVPIGDFTVYARLPRPGWAGTTGGASATIVGLNTTAVTNGAWEVYYEPSGPYVISNVGAGASFSAATEALPAGSVNEICAQFRNLATGPQTRIDPGSGTFGSWATAGTVPITSWDATTLYLGGRSSARIGAGIRRIIVAAGLRAASELRGPQP